MSQDKKFNQLAFLESFRGLAALTVMIGHARWLLWEGYMEAYVKHPEQYNFFEKILVYFFSLFKFGHEAVLFFFILSGFVIHLKYSKKIKEGKDLQFDLKDYLLRRIRRIYPPFLFAVLMTYILDRIGMSQGYNIYFNRTSNELFNSNIQAQNDLGNLIGNLFFIKSQLLHINIWGTNSPTWSLKIEWWFYIIYPLIFIFSKRSVLKSVLFVLAILTVALILPPESIPFAISVGKYLALWWMGGLLADVYTGRVKIGYRYLAFFVILLPLMAVLSSKVESGTVFIDSFWALGFFGLLSFCFYLQEKGYSFKWADKIKWLGECSYTIYIIHFPILVFMNGMLLKHTGNVMPQSFAYVALAIVAITGISYLLHFVVEKPFLTKRK